MNEANFWAAVTPYLERDAFISIEDLQAALSLPEKESEEVASHYCSERKLFRIVTRHSWGYIRTDPNKPIRNLTRCGGSISHKKRTNTIPFDE